MRARTVFSTAAVFCTLCTLCTLVGCSSQMPGGGSQTAGAAGTTSSGGDTEPAGSGGAGAGGGDTGGTTSSGGTTGAGGSGDTGGMVSTGGAGASGGAGGGSGNSGGTVGAAGSSSRGGSSGSSGTTGSGGIAGSVGKGGSGGTGGTTAAYQGPCDLLASGCAEAYGVARAMTLKYTGPLFQIGLAKDKTKLLDIGQTADHKADMTTWSAFCSASQANCVVSKIYAQIHTGPNDLVPGVFKTPWNPDCSAGGFTCAAKFTIEAATGLPILTTDAPAEYSLSNDNFATGINGGAKAMGIMYNGKPVANQVHCCGVIGLPHKYNATDTTGPDF